MKTSPAVRAAGWGVLALTILASLTVRCLPWANFRAPGGGFYFYSLDSYDHLRRVTLNLASFPALANFDYYAAFPKGLGQIWSPVFDYGLALLCRLAGGGRVATETLCFFFNPAAAVLCLLAVFFIARATFQSQAAGWAAAMVLALHPAYLAYSLPMNFDHHAVEPLLALSLFALPLLERRGRLTTAGIILTGLALPLVILIWRGCTVYWGLFFLTALIRSLTANNRPLAQDYALGFGVAALLVAAYCLIDPFGNARQMSFAVISWFHVGVLAAAGLALALLRLCRSRRLFFLLAGGLLAIIAVTAAIGPLAGVARQVLSGISFLRGKGDPWLDTNSELRGVFRTQMGLWYAASYLTAFWFLSPVALWHGFNRLKNGKETNGGVLTFIIWSPLLFMGFIIRYSHIAGVFSSLTAAYFASLFEEKGRIWQAPCLTALLLMPGWPHYREAMTAALPAPMRYGLYGQDGVLAWLRDKTPPTSYWLNPVRRPEYGVLARWSLGAKIYQLARRPAVATGFGWEAYGFYQEAGFWAAVDESKAQAIIREAKIRYVLAQAVHDLHTDYLVASQGQQRGKLPPGTVPPVFNPGRTLQNRLMMADGSVMKSGGELLPALGTLRLVHESDYLATPANGTAPGLSYYKVFEAVTGAMVTGRAAPGERVILDLDLQTGRGRRFPYLTLTYAGPDGQFSVRVPYATGVRQGDTQVLGDYAVYLGQERQGSLAVSESDIESGRTLSWQAGRP